LGTQLLGSLKAPLEEPHGWVLRRRNDAMDRLGVLRGDRGELAEAEGWWRRAADAGDSDAMDKLGVLLHDRGELDEAEVWWRRAAEADDTNAM
jgi:TPR repeat protein